MQCVTLVTLGLTTDLSKDQDYYVAKDKYMLDFSKEKNIVVMLFDAFQSSYFQQAIEDIPEAQEIFENFVFFDNATGTSLFSEEGSATILTGNQLRPDLTFSENIDYIYSESSFLPELKKQNFDVRYYMQTKMVSGSADKIIKNIVKEGQETDISYPIFQMMNRITSFCYMPHIIKQYFWFSYKVTFYISGRPVTCLSPHTLASWVFGLQVCTPMAIKCLVLMERVGLTSTWSPSEIKRSN